MQKTTLKRKEVIMFSFSLPEPDRSNRGVERNIDINSMEGVYSIKELFDRQTNEIPCLIEPILPSVGICALAGSSDTGKSSLLRQMAISITLGKKNFLGFNINSIHQSVIYISTEDDDIAISYLINKAQNDESYNVDELNDELIFITQISGLWSKLNDILSVKKVDLIVVDSFTDLYSNSMNDSNQVRGFLNRFNALAYNHHCLVLFLHHVGKRTEGLKPSKHNLLGSQGFEAKMRVVLELRKDNCNSTLRHLCVLKGNYLPEAFKEESFVLKFNENMLFSYTQERVLFSKLNSSTNWKLECDIRELSEKGYKQVEIAKKLKISQPTVSRVLNS
ncbi:AAA family ATPase [Psychroserpens sp.]|uniref:AAA family ATPase n=1 Tax=Psychroserpens sp. TaxID=2020870 RepID=UPI001B143213|nr:AAA family ATPase [Psychroserpens sp.]MBO6607409.1 AAA family ATPase [Psychroserpens sp.]MBO6654513.1 AAA family ATPase [Psychroserpens sp.]MBO6681138.1 AAA family ATPase [Psychroserpens sp.]MBO6749905.1 AAA family ATPase [Psychroserpens sp.]MBO6916107.1 AAA family ATPase [Psychroserpens sp.]